MLRLTILLTLPALLASSGAAQTTSAPSNGIVCLTCRKSADATIAPFAPRKTVIGQRLDAFEPWITHLAGQKPVVVQTRRATLVTLLDGGPVDALSDDEIGYLHTTFPTIGPAVPAGLDAHQQAHLLAHRLQRIEGDIRDLLALDAEGRIKPEAGPYQPLASDHVEVFVFGSKAGYDAFTTFLFDRDVWPLAGTLLDSGPTSAVLLPSLKDPSARRQFTFTASMQLLRALSRAGSGLQGWIQVGLSHALEDRHSAKAGRTPPGATLPPGADAPKDWDAFVGDLIVGAKVGDLGALAATPAHALTVRSRLQSWSLVRWMIEKDPKKFAELVRHLLHAPPSESPQKALLNALRPSFGHDLVTLLDEWKTAVQKSRSAAK